MPYWICPTPGHPVVVSADTHEEAREKIERSPAFRGGKLFALPVEFYANLCEEGGIESSLFLIERGIEDEGRNP